MLGILVWVVAILVVVTLLLVVIGAAGMPAAAALLALHLAFVIVHALSTRIRAATRPLLHWRKINEDAYETDMDGAVCRATLQPGPARSWRVDAVAPDKSVGERAAIERRAWVDWQRQPMRHYPQPVASEPAPVGVQLRRRLRFVTTCAAIAVIVAVAVPFLGPLWSGALFLLLPHHGASPAGAVPQIAAPLHRGHIDLPTGLYIREDDDLVLDGNPPVALRRTYLSGYRVSRQFGIGATHDAESYLIGDGATFRWAALILANGSRVQFDRTSAGSSLATAMYVHRATPSEYQAARLGWVGFGWAMRLDDGRLELFRPCGPSAKDVCAKIQSRDGDGHTARFLRDGRGRLLRMEGAAGWIAFDYDAQERIVRARDSRQRVVRYGYDEAGRLASAEASDRTLRMYTYTDRDEMETIREPGRSVVNTYDAGGRVTRQVTWTIGEAEPYLITLSYQVDGGRVVQTEVTESDGTWRRLACSRGYPTAESYRRGDAPETRFEYTRDPVTNRITRITVACTDRRGRPVTRSSPVTTGDVEWIKQDLVQMGCAFSSWVVPR